LVVFKV